MTKGLGTAKRRTEDAMSGKLTLKGANFKMFREMRLKAGTKYHFASNVSGSAGKRCKCKCSSWAAHWRRKTGKILKSQKCYVRGCRRKAAVGAHVFIDGKGNKQMILPFCSKHNARAVTIGLALKYKKDAVPAYDKLP